MIRPFTCLSVLLAAGSGLYLYSEKHRTTLLDDRIRAIAVETGHIEDRTSMLRAEWALLNQPDRLQSLASRFLPQLQPIAPTQFVQLADLGKHLPPVGAPPAPQATPEMPQANPTAPQATPEMPQAAPDAVIASASAESDRGRINQGQINEARINEGRAVQTALASAPPALPAAPSSDVVKPEMLAEAAMPHPQAAPTRAPVTRVTARTRHAPPHRPVTELAAARDVVPAGAARPIVREAAAYARPAPTFAGAWRPAPATWHPVAAPSAYGGSALGMAHVAMAPPMPVAP